MNTDNATRTAAGSRILPHARGLIQVQAGVDAGRERTPPALRYRDHGTTQPREYFETDGPATCLLYI